MSPDGRRFLMIKDQAGIDPTATTSMVVVLNWLTWACGPRKAMKLVSE